MRTKFEAEVCTGGCPDADPFTQLLGLVLQRWVSLKERTGGGQSAYLGQVELSGKHGGTEEDRGILMGGEAVHVAD